MSKSNNNNILLVANYESNVGYAWWLMEEFWSAIAGHFSLKGCKTFLIYPHITIIPEIISAAPIQIEEIDFSDQSRSNLIRLREFIKKNQISCVYLTDKPYYDLIYIKLRSWGVKYILNHDHKPGERPKIRILRRLIKRIIYSVPWFSCDLYIGVSEFVKTRLINNGGIPKSRCTYVRNGIRPIDFDSQCQSYAYKIFNIKNDKKIIISTGRATYYKGIDFLIECANYLVNIRKNYGVVFLYCGNGPDLEKFKDLVSGYNLSEYFIFAGHRNDVRCLLQSCQIGIQTSTGEAFSLSILEYLSAGLATLAPDNCGNSEAIINNQTGILYPPRNKEYVVNCLEKLINDNDLVSRLSNAGKASVLKQFTIDRAKHELVTVIDEFMNRNSSL